MIDTRTATFDEIPGWLPIAAVPPDTDIAKVAEEAIHVLNGETLDSLTRDVIWRDFIAFTGTYRTLCSRDAVRRVFSMLGEAKKRSPFELAQHKPRIEHSLEDSSWIDVDFQFTTHEGHLVGKAAGIASVVCCDDGRWRVWMIRTWLDCFDGLGNPDESVPSQEVNQVNGADQREQVNGGIHPGLPPSDVTSQANGSPVAMDEILDLAIIGAGQAGLSLAGRSQALGLKYLLFERNESVGDVWKKRYESLFWHTPKEYGELPFGKTFFKDDPSLIPTKTIAARHKAWSEKHGINVKTGCCVESAQWDHSTALWTCQTTKGSWRARNLVISIGGVSATPVLPSWATSDKVASSGYLGTIIHGADYQNCHQYKGKRGVVVGTANTGHDVADDMVRAGMETSILQRGATFVMPIEWLHGGMAPHYNEHLPTERGDRESFTLPNKIFREMLNRNVHSAVKANAERFDALEKAGFQLDRYGDLATNIYVRAGGHYIDHGCSAKIASGQIRMLNKPVESLTKTGLRFEDGSELETDLIVCCTGFDHDFRKQARALIGEIADQVDPYLGLDAEGEIRGLSRPSGHPHLYYHGGDVRSARWFSRFIALRLQAEKLGCPLEVYRD